jgi:hypothetical protein
MTLQERPQSNRGHATLSTRIRALPGHWVHASFCVFSSVVEIVNRGTRRIYGKTRSYAVVQFLYSKRPRFVLPRKRYPTQISGEIGRFSVHQSTNCVTPKNMGDLGVWGNGCSTQQEVGHGAARRRTSGKTRGAPPGSRRSFGRPRSRRWDHPGGAALLGDRTAGPRTRSPTQPRDPAAPHGRGREPSGRQGEMSGVRRRIRVETRPTIDHIDRRAVGPARTPRSLPEMSPVFFSLCGNRWALTPAN